MKKSLFTLMFLAMAITTFAQQWMGISNDQPTSPKATLVTSNEQKIVVDFSLDGFQLAKVNTPNGLQQIVSVPKMASMLEAGAPDLPQFPIPAIIGDYAEMSVKVISSEYTDYEGIEIAPSKGNFSRQIDPESVPYTYGEMYSQNAFYPAQQAYLEAPYILRDFRGQNIMVRPFTYNPVTKTLRVYHNITIEMYKVSDNGVNPKTTRKSGAIKIDPQFKAEYNRRFINYGQSTAKYTFVEDQGEMIVICPEQYMEAMQPLVDWKNQSGRPTTMVSLATAGGNSDTQIKNYIQNIYNDPAHNLTFVLLVGDYADLTPHSMSGGRSDNWFVMLDGSDYYTEAFIGRFSVNNVNDVTHQVDKVLYYERDMTSNVTYGDKGLGIGYIGAGSGHFGEDDYQHIDLIRDSLLHYTYSTVTELHGGGGGASTSSISAAINSGVSIINYCNHGSETSWGVASYSNSHVNALTNDNKWPYIISVACLNGQFNYSSGDCFAEAWMKATNNSTGVPTGAIGGMFSWISQPWIPPMYGQDEMIDILCEWRSTDMYNHTMGGTSLNGSMYILDAAPSDNGETHNTWLLFGDPSLLLRTDNPTDINLTCNPSQLLVGMTTLTVNAMDVDYGIATLSMNGEVLASAQIRNGSATLNFDAVSNVGDATLTVIAYNKVTKIQTIEVIPADGAYVTVDSYTPTSAHVGDQTEMSITFKNVGNDPTTGNTNVTLSCNGPVTFQSPTKSFGTLSANATITVSGFRYTINEGVADGTIIPITVTMVNGTDTWEGTANITAGEAVLEYTGFTWPGEYVPGETVNVTAKFKNTGHYMATNAAATITSSSSYVTLPTNPIAVGTIEPDAEVSCTFPVTISSSCPETQVIDLTFNLTADGGLTAQGTGTLSNSCEVLFTLNDSYGDGWNGATLTVSFSDGSPSQTISFTCSGWSGCSTHEETLTISSGTVVTVTFNSGSYNSECSLTIAYVDGEQIYQSGTGLSAGVLTTFTMNCSGVAAEMPTVTTTAVSNIAQSTATGGGNVTDDGGAEVTARGICWSTSHNPTVSGSHTTNGTGTGSFTANMTGLTAGTTYYVRAYATNSEGTAYGNEVSFTTQSASLATVTTISVSDITETTATSGGNITANGGAAVTARGICWSTSHNPTVSGNHTTNGTGNGAFTANMTGLTPGTTYYVRAYATNSAGTAYGSEKTFTTLQDATGLIGDADVNGQVNINDVLAIMRHALQIQTLDGQGLQLADVNGNGSVDMNDAVILLRTVLGIAK